MARMLVLGNFELTLGEIPEGQDAEQVIRAMEREILTFLQRLSAGDGHGGSVESLELESFGYAPEQDGSASQYYYNKFEREPEARTR